MTADPADRAELLQSDGHTMAGATGSCISMGGPMQFHNKYNDHVTSREAKLIYRLVVLVLLPIANDSDTKLYLQRDKQQFTNHEMVV